MIEISRHPSGTGNRLVARMRLPVARDRLFEFFSDAWQLESITPSWLHFRVVTPKPINMSTGTLIDYRLRLRGIPIRWQSRISQWEPPVRFVDEQMMGPYRKWHHLHEFLEDGSGTMCVDEVHYRVWGGWLVNRLLVERDLRTIFDFRQKRLAEIFG